MHPLDFPDVSRAPAPAIRWQRVMDFNSGSRAGKPGVPVIKYDCRAWSGKPYKNAEDLVMMLEALGVIE